MSITSLQTDDITITGIIISSMCIITSFCAILYFLVEITRLYKLKPNRESPIKDQSLPVSLIVDETMYTKEVPVSQKRTDSRNSDPPYFFCLAKETAEDFYNRSNKNQMVGKIYSNKFHFGQEVRILSKFINSKAFLTLYGYSETPQMITFLKKEPKAINLGQFNFTKFKLNMNTRFNIIKDVATAVSELHRIGIIHLVLLPKNIIIVDFSSAKVDGFEFATQIGKTINNMEGLKSKTRLPLSLIYVCPEFFNTNKWENVVLTKNSKAIDIYSLGMIIFKMFGRDPDFGSSELQIVVRRDAT